MAEISAQLVKQLRDITGAGMMECKKALQATNGDINAAVDELRKQGIGSASKKEGRATKQGLISAYISANGKQGVLVEVNCESDFVARTEDFQTLTADVAAHIAETKPKYVRAEQVTAAERENFKQHEALYEQKFVRDESTTIGDLVRTKIAKLGENIAVSRFVLYDLNGNGAVGNYVHTGSQIGVLLEVHTDKQEITAKDEFKTLVRDIAMQIAAASPQFVSKENVPRELLDKERAIQRERALGEGKPEKMVDKIAEGRMSKFYEEVCLMEQPFIRENTISVADLMRTVSGKLGGTVSVARFVRFKVGDAHDAPGVAESPLPVTA
ncbi:MAG: elongation factor Ts [Acidobacteriaceae bacterium]|nr:elongation factor Ts [Acidobacteriaceae bacterium]MBV9441710.1 elongation factor Ts [Acidobacteriaceae bacterium]